MYVGKTSDNLPWMVSPTNAAPCETDAQCSATNNFRCLGATATASGACACKEGYTSSGSGSWSVAFVFTSASLATIVVPFFDGCLLGFTRPPAADAVE